METMNVQYETGAASISAIVSDIQGMFSWDSVAETQEGNNTYTQFAKSCGGTCTVGLRVKHSSSRPSLGAFVYNGTNTYTTDVSQLVGEAAYAYGNSGFAICVGSSLPCEDTSTTRGATFGIANSTNLLTGDTNYCSFALYGGNLSFFSRDTKSAASWSPNLYKNAPIGAAISLHHPSHSFVADSMLMLTAIPDSITGCLRRVFFNGASYIRLGALLIPED